MNKRILLVALCLVLVVAMALPGCAPARRPYDNTNLGARTGYAAPGPGYTNPGATGYTTPGTTKTGIGMGTTTGYGTTGVTTPKTTGYTTPGTTGYITPGTTTNTVSDRLATAVRQIAGVSNSAVVVSGNTAYVGVTLTGTTGTTGAVGTTSTTVTTANTNDVKRRAAQMVRAAEPSIKTVYVSTDAGFMNRLRTVEQGVRSGSPITGFTTELRNLIRGLTPAR